MEALNTLLRKQCGPIGAFPGWLRRRLVVRRDRGVTMLLRVHVSSGAAGVLAITLSHQAAGFAPCAPP